MPDFSFNCNPSRDHCHFSRNWKISSADIIDFVTKYPWSPCLWTDGVRKKDAFLGSDYMALDIDDDFISLQKARDYITSIEAWAIIAPTKSHQKPKPPGNKIHDRYRLVFRFSKRIEDPEIYTQTLKHWALKFRADLQCCDPARMFFPSVSAEVIPGKKSFFPIITPPAITPTIRSSFSRQNLEVPLWVKKFLERGTLTKSGSRDKTIFAVSIALLQRGWSEFEIYSRISASPFSREDFPDNQIRQKIISAKKYV